MTVQFPKTDAVSSALSAEADGTIHVPAFDLPLSAALSPQARDQQAAAMASGMAGAIVQADRFTNEAEFSAAVDAFRAGLDEGFARPAVEGLLAALPVAVRADRIGGVAIEEFTPIDGCDEETVLINLHGGAYYSGAIHVARIESIPVAHFGKFRVVSVDYRQGYEHKFPAASEDVAAVYSALLESYPASRIGIFGGSAGGMLTAQATAWIIRHGLPVPGAIGVLGAGSSGAGDSDYFAAIGTAQVPPSRYFESAVNARVGYFSDASLADPLVNPIVAPEAFRAQFPPTLLITATRAFDMSPAIALHRALVQADVDASLHVFDGLGHCFYYNVALPESMDAYRTITRFFRKHLSR